MTMTQNVAKWAEISIEAVDCSDQSDQWCKTESRGKIYLPGQPGLVTSGSGKDTVKVLEG